MDTVSASASLDLTGKSITTYIVYEAANTLRTLAEGDRLKLVTDDSEPIRRDLEAWSEATGHRLVESATEGTTRMTVIEKGPARSTATKAAIVISTAGLEELLSPLGLALGAALEDIEVHVYLLGPAVHIMERGFKARLSGWMRPFSRFARRGMAKTGHIAPPDKLRQLLDLGGHIYLCGPSMDHFKVRKEDMIVEDLPVIEYLTFAKVMADADIHFFV